MSGPIILKLPKTPTQTILDAVGSCGILIEPKQLGYRKSKKECFRCQRKPASFDLTIWTEDEHDSVFVLFTADTSAFRWYNFLIVWVVAVFRVRQELRLQQDAKQVLIEMGAKQVEGYDMNPNQVGDDTN